MSDTITIEVMAEKWVGFDCSKKRITIAKLEDDIFISGQKVEKMEFNDIQLRFVMSGGVLYLLFDGRTESSLSIKQIYEQLV